MITDVDMKRRIGESLGSEGTPAWIDATFEIIHQAYGLIDIDDLSHEEYWEIVVSADPDPA
jgi:hypothetical protein